MINNKSVKFVLGNETLTINNTPNEFDLLIKNDIVPKKNTAIEGLYMSNGMFCTQCEAQGFRRITYFPDRPDVMATYKVRIEASKKEFPVLLSNGNEIDKGLLDEGRHFVTWQDPFPTPSYLFSLVGGILTYLEDYFET